MAMLPSTPPTACTPRINPISPPPPPSERTTNAR